MLLNSMTIEADAFAVRTGWQLKPEGACKGEICVPLPDAALRDGRIDVATVAGRLGMPLVADEANAMWALGPETSVSGHALTTAVAPDLVLPDVITGQDFALASLRGQKVLLVAWASW